jgi:DNA polymerase I-like protein with 3'-5' exonuclease and polymerase domains
LSNRNYGLVRNEEDLDRFVDRLLDAGKPFAFDIETGYTGPLRGKGALQHYAPDYVVAGISFTNDPNWARYAALNHEDGPNLDNLLAARALWRLLRSGMGIAHNALMELSGMSRFFRDNLSDDDTVIPGTDGITFKEEVLEDGGLFPVLSDTMIESMLTAEHKKKGLKELSEDILGVTQTKLIELFTERSLKGLNASGKYVKYNTTNLRFNVLPLDADVVAYACEDSALTLEHHGRTYEGVKDLLIFKTELRLTPILVRMEREGMYLDWAEYERRSRDVTEFRDQYAEYVMDVFSKVAGEMVNINLNAPKQVADVLFNKMGIKPTLYTDGGQASTGVKAMRTLLGKHPEIKSLLQYREVAKLLGTYIDKYLNEFRYDPTGRAHPNHNTGGTVTGRFSVDQVSYQQWPKPYHYELPSGATLDLNYRNFLISPDDFRIIGFDYANVELRIVAGLANETAMLEAFANGVDIHKATASKMLKIPLEDVTDKERSVGKTLNFAIVYGSGADNIAELITAATGELCTVEMAEGYLADYFLAFPELKAWMDERVLEGHEVHPKARESMPAHRVTTAFGRRIPIIEYESPFKGVRNKGDRNAVNGPVQGAAADYMKIAMVRVDKTIRQAEKDGVIPVGSVRLIMTIHDALEFYVHKDVSTRTVIDLLEPAVSYKVGKTWDGQDLVLPTIRADWHEGYRWGSVAEIEQTEDGSLIYSRKLELPDKSKHKFIDDTLDGLVAQIDKFWEERNASELDARVLEELDFVYDEDEDEFVLPVDNSNLGDHFTDAQMEAILDDIPEDEGRSMIFDEPVSEPVAEKEVFIEALAAGKMSDEEFDEFNSRRAPAEDDTPTALGDPIVPVEEEEPEWLHSPGYAYTRLRLTLFSMPTTENWPKFQEYLKEHMGTAQLVVVMPQGEVTIERTGLTPDSQADLQLIFGEASLKVDETESISEKVLEGIEL